MARGIYPQHTLHGAEEVGGGPGREGADPTTPGGVIPLRRPRPPRRGRRRRPLWNIGQYIPPRAEICRPSDRVAGRARGSRVRGKTVRGKTGPSSVSVSDPDNAPRKDALTNDGVRGKTGPSDRVPPRRRTQFTSSSSGSSSVSDESVSRDARQTGAPRRAVDSVRPPPRGRLAPRSRKTARGRTVSSLSSASSSPLSAPDNGSIGDKDTPNSGGEGKNLK